MKIAQICYLYSPAVGGVEHHVKNLSERLVKAGHEVHVHCLDLTGWHLKRYGGPSVETIAGVRVIRQKAAELPRSPWIHRTYAPGLVDGLQDEKYDILHVHSFPSHHFDVAWRLSRQKQIPLVATGHFSPDDFDRLWNSPLPGFYWRWWMRPRLRSTDKLVAIVPSEAKRYTETLGVEQHRVTVVPNGFDHTELEAVTDTKARSWKKKQPFARARIILSVARLNPKKGMDLLIPALTPLLRQDPALHLLMVGVHQFPDFDALLERQRKESGLGRQITICELPRQETIAAFKTADVVILPSRGEVFGITLLEGMYCGKIVVGSNAGGIPELVKHGHNGYLFRSEDVSDLAGVLRKALARSKTNERIRTVARREAEQYDWDHLAQKIEQIYEEVTR